MPASYDEDRPNVATGTGSVKPKKKKGGGKPVKRGNYDWGDGKGRVHSIPLSVHRQNVEARRYGINLDDPLSAPLSNRQAYGMAEAGADRVYGPQIQTQKDLINSLDPWFQNYVSGIGAQRQAAAAFAQPYTQAAQTAVQNAGQTAPGLDPNSPQAATEQQAAAGRQAIAQSSANTLAAIPIATDNAYGNAIILAQRELPQMRAYNAQQLQSLQGQRGNAIVEGYGQIRSGEQNAQIAYGALGVDQQRAADDAAEAVLVSQDRAASRRVSRRNTRDRIAASNNRPVTSGAFAGMTQSEIAALSPAERTRMRDAYNNRGGKDKGKGGQSAEERKRIEGIRKATGEFKARIGDAIGDWDRIAREPFPYEQIDPKTNKKVTKTRKATPDEIRAAMRKAGYTPQEIHIALLRRVNKPLDKAAIQYMRAKGIRIPRDWLKGSVVPGGYGDPKPTGGQQNGLGGK